MIIYNDIYHWEGLGKKFGLATGRIRLRIFNLSQDPTRKVIPLRPILVVVSDVPGELLTVKGWAGPLASFIVRQFNLDRHRLRWIEYYPAVTYGAKSRKYIPEKFELVEFAWKDGTAVHPQWRELRPAMLDIVRDLVHASALTTS